MQRAAMAFMTVSALILGLPSLATAQAAVPSSGTKNAINGINSYPGPEFVKYAKEREPQDRRIDLFIGDWQGSLPRVEHGSLVLRDILIRGDNFAPSQKSAVLLYRGDVDAWLATRFSARGLEKSEAQADQSSRAARSNLREGIRTARELRTANHKLTEQITASVRLLTERCDLLSTQRLQEPWSAVEPAAVPDLLPTQGTTSGAVRSERIA